MLKIDHRVDAYFKGLGVQKNLSQPEVGDSGTGKIKFIIPSKIRDNLGLVEMVYFFPSQSMNVSRAVSVVRLHRSISVHSIAENCATLL